MEGYFWIADDTEKYKLITDEGIVFTVTKAEAKQIMLECELPTISRNRIMSGLTSKGWSFTKV